MQPYDLDRAVAWLTSRVPVACRAGDALDACTEMDPRRAMQQRYRAAWTDTSIGVLVVDVDHDDPYGAVLAGRVPPPLVWVHNTITGHSQPRYILRAPLSGRNGNAGGLLDDTRLALAAAWEGDTAFRGPMVRGEFHPEHQTELGRLQAYSLTELRAELPATPRADRVLNDLHAAAGRNCALFDALRLEAYAELRRAPSGATLLAYVEHRAEQMNGTFAKPLRVQELRYITKSIHRWCMRHRDELLRRAPRKAARLPGAARNCDRLPADRVTLSETEQRANMQSGQQLAADSRREATRGRIRVAVAALRRQQATVSTAAVVTATGLSRATVKRHRDLLRDP